MTLTASRAPSRTTPRLALVDWGVGGVGVFRALRSRAPDVPVLYVSDSGATPYGRLPRPALAERVARVLRTVVDEGAVGVVVACNAASTALRDIDARELGVPVIGMIDAATRAVEPGFRGTLGMLGGVRTIRAGLHHRALSRPGVRIVGRIAQPLSAHVEAGTIESDACARDLDRITSTLRDVDALLLACTHYPALASQLARRLPGVRLLDPADSVVDAVLETFPLPRGGTDRVLTTGERGALSSVARRAWGVELEKVETVSLSTDLRCDA